MRQLISGLAALGLLMAFSVAPVSAGTGSISIGNGGADGETGDSFSTVDGGPWSWNGMCDGDVGTLFDSRIGWIESRTAFEFPITELPDGATITGATLTLSHAWGNGLDTIAIYGYAGDGTVNAADMVVTGPSVSFQAGTTYITEDHDVTALLTSAVVASGWAGFSLRAEPPNFVEPGSGHSFGCPRNIDFPILTIHYASEDPDEDLDGVPDPDDVCPGTVPDSFPQLSENRYSYDGTGLVSGLAGNPSYTIQQTGGCSAMQIIAAMGLGGGHEKFGLSRSALEAWIAALL
jgi:hypothetical protein